MTTGNFVIRHYQKDDLSSVFRLWEVTGMGNPYRGDTEEIIEDTICRGGALLIMEEKSSAMICGTSWMTFDGRRIYLHHFGIHPEYQGRGLARMLLNESLLFVKSKGFQVKLEVHKTNKRAINLYTKAGFEKLGDYEVFIIRDGKIIKEI